MINLTGLRDVVANLVCWVVVSVLHSGEVTLSEAGGSMVRGDWIGLYFVFSKVCVGSSCGCGLVLCFVWNVCSCLVSVVCCGGVCVCVWYVVLGYCVILCSILCGLVWCGVVWVRE